MEKFQELLEDSKSKLEIAEQVVMKTFPMTKDPKLLMNATDNLFLSMTYAMGAMLHFERANQRIVAFDDKFEQKTEIFEKSCMPRYGIGNEYMIVMKRLKDIIVDHHRSAMVFAKNEQLVICGDDYKIRKLGYDEIKRYLFHTGSFYTAIAQIIESQNAGEEKRGEKGRSFLQRVFGHK